MNANKYKTASLWKKMVQESQTTEKKPSPPTTTSASTPTSVSSSQTAKFNIHAVATSLMERRRLDREKELKVKQDEIDELRAKHGKIEEEKKKLQSSLDQVLTSQNDAGQKLMRTNEALEKVRLENKRKTEQIEKLQGKISFMEDRIRNLENRASEVEKAELTLESTKKILEGTIAECRAKDTEIRRTLVSKEETEKKLEISTLKIKDLENKINDLKFQVRHELMKNETIEKNLDTIPILKEDIKEKEEQITKLKKDIEEKSALLLAARKAIRDYKDKLRDVDKATNIVEEMKKELTLSQCEVMTLKNLMAGKDKLVLQKCRALELAKETIDCLEKSPDLRHKVQRIEQILDNLSRLTESNADSKTHNGTGFSRYTAERKSVKTGQTRPMTSHHLRESSKENVIDVSVPPYSNENSGNDGNKQVSSNSYFERLSTRPKTAIGAHRSWSAAETNSHSHSGSLGNFRRPGTFVANGDSGLRKNLWSQRRYQTRSIEPKSSLDGSKGDDSDTDSDSSCQEINDAMFKMSHEYRNQISKMSAADKDSLLSRVLNIGDRVSVSVPQKAPKYGRKKPKPIVYTGIVRYKGTLDKEYFDATVYVGIKLDGPIGDSDGIYKGKRYMFTPPEHGKFVKIRDVTSMLDIHSGHYEPMMKMMILQLVKESQYQQQV